MQAKWYSDYIDKFGVGALDALYDSLFSNGEQGAWYDPSDITTLSQDTSGVTPVTAVGQPIARVLDLSGNVANATQATTASRPLYARVPQGGVRNLFRNSMFAGFLVGNIPTQLTSSEGVTISGSAGVGNPLIDISATGTDDVGGWIDVRIYGTNTSGATRFVSVMDESVVDASPGMSMVVSVDLRVIANVGPSTPSVRLFNQWRDASNTLLGGLNYPTSPTATMTRFTSGASVAPANTARVVNRGLYFIISDGETIDYTLRIRRLQTELSPVETAYQATRLYGVDITETGKANRFAILDDQVDDALVATLPAGTYTVAYGDDAGVTILTGQSISGAYTIPGPKRLYGAVIVDRALTASETSDVTSWINVKRP